VKEKQNLEMIILLMDYILITSNNRLCIDIYLYNNYTKILLVYTVILSHLCVLYLFYHRGNKRLFELLVEIIQRKFPEWVPDASTMHLPLWSEFANK
jgi:hypothetical protein